MPQDNELLKLVDHRKILALFDLEERQRKVVLLRAKGLSFNHIGALSGNVSEQMARKVFERAMKRIRKQLLQMLEEKAGVGAKPKAATRTDLEHFIAAFGVVDNGSSKNTSPLAVGW